MTHDELRKLCDEATPEPWVGWVLPCRSASDGPERGGVSGLPFINYDRCTHFKPQDARFIAAARTAVPALLDELERMYAVMSAQRRIEISPDIGMVSHLEGWIVYHKGLAVNVDASMEIIYLPFQAALARAWELERGA